MRVAALVLIVACSTPATTGDPFWSYFTSHAAELHAEPLETAMASLQTALSPAHPGVLVELAADGEHRTLVLTADGDRALFPEIELMAKTHPTVAGWDVVAFRPAVEARPLPEIAMDGRTLDPEQVRYIGERAGTKLDITVFVPDYTPQDRALQKLVYIALDHCVGEYAVETKLGAISLVPLAKAPASAAPIGYLPTELAKF